MGTFKAAVLREHFKPLSVETFNMEEPGEGQVLVKMISAGLCGAQMNEINAVKGIDKYLPHFMGHEGFGRVLSVGNKVTKVNKGDYVVLHWRKGRGCDCFGGKYFSDLGIVGSGPVTTFAEQTIVAENRVTPVDYSRKLANLYPLTGCALSTAYGIVKNINSKRKVLITGAGGLGLSIAFWLKVFNMPCTLVDLDEEKRDIAETFGARFESIETYTDILKEHEKVDYCIDTTGNVEIMSDLFNLLDKNGTLLLVGQPRVGMKLTLDNPLSFFDGKKILSSDGGDFNPDRDMGDIIFYLEKHVEFANKLITHTIKLDDINKGFDLMRNNKSGRIIINFEENK